MRVTIILFLLPALACAEITVDIETATAKNETSVTFNGTDSKIITGVEIESFNITPSNLKAAVSKHAGGNPLDVFVKSPTPWGDLYKTYNWTEVSRTTTVKQVKIVNYKTETVILYKQSYINKLNNSDIVYNADVKAYVDNYVKNNYTGKLISVDADYNIDLAIGSYVHKPLRLVSHLGVSSFVKEAMKIQVKEKFSLKPSQAAILILNTTKVTMNVSIEYESRLNGDVTANYYPKYKGHHFWAYDVNDIIKPGGISAVDKSTDVVTIEYYTNAFGYITDKNTGSLIAKVPANYYF